MAWRYREPPELWQPRLALWEQDHNGLYVVNHPSCIFSICDQVVGIDQARQAGNFKRALYLAMHTAEINQRIERAHAHSATPVQ